MKLSGVLARLGNASYRYVAITTMVSLLSFARNLLFMKTLGLPELGQIAMMQTLIMLVGFAQLGLINGAYIQYAARDEAINGNMVNLLSTCLLILLPLCTVLFVVLMTSTDTPKLVLPATLAFGFAAGIATLASNWLNNTLVADGLLLTSNRVNIGAVALSLGLALLSYPYGINVACLSILAQPVTVALTILVLRPQLRPTRITLDRETLTLVLRLGFMPFLSGLAVLAMHQVERWTIAAELGATALGEFYLVIMFTTFFTLIPVALMNVHFPQAKRAHTSGQSNQLMEISKRHSRDLLIYFLVVSLALFAFAPTLVNWLVPDAASSTHLLYYALPALILFTMRDSASLVLFSTGKVKPILNTAATTLGLFWLGLLLLAKIGAFTLASVLLVRALATLPGTGYLLRIQRHALRNQAVAP